MFENRVWKRIFALKKDEMKGKWRKLYKKEIHKLFTRYYTTVLSRNMGTVQRCCIRRKLPNACVRKTTATLSE
jgi:hypothetical protein